MSLDRIATRILGLLGSVLVVASIGGCSKTSSSGPGSAATGSATAKSFLTVDSYCTPFCDKLCGTCGDGSCKESCKPRCLFGRAPDSLLDGKDPKVALALTRSELDACLGTITAESCPEIMAGKVPPACFTIQH